MATQILTRKQRGDMIRPEDVVQINSSTYFVRPRPANPGMPWQGRAKLGVRLLPTTSSRRHMQAHSRRRAEFSGSRWNRLIASRLDSGRRRHDQMPRMLQSRHSDSEFLLGERWGNDSTVLVSHMWCWTCRCQLTDTQRTDWTIPNFGTPMPWLAAVDGDRPTGNAQMRMPSTKSRLPRLDSAHDAQTAAAPITSKPTCNSR